LECCLFENDEFKAYDGKLIQGSLFICADVAVGMSSARLYIGRLSDSAKDRDVERFFKGYGRIREIVLKSGYGFIVSFSAVTR